MDEGVIVLYAKPFGLFSSKINGLAVKSYCAVVMNNRKAAASQWVSFQKEEFAQKMVANESQSHTLTNKAEINLFA
jgi:hypothetical protein